MAGVGAVAGQVGQNAQAGFSQGLLYLSKGGNMVMNGYKRVTKVAVDINNWMKDTVSMLPLPVRLPVYMVGVVLKWMISFFGSFAWLWGTLYVSVFTWLFLAAFMMPMLVLERYPDVCIDVFDVLIDIIRVLYNIVGGIWNVLPNLRNR